MKPRNILHLLINSSRKEQRILSDKAAAERAAAERAAAKKWALSAREMAIVAHMGEENTQQMEMV